GRISSWIEKHPSLDVRLEGHLGEDELLRLYAASDTFALPSMRDPNPLAVIEALWAGLPLILSERVGNCFEALKPGANGWLFDPDSPQSLKACLDAWSAAGQLQLAACGEASTKIARERFETRAVIEGFLDELIGSAGGLATAI